MYVCVYVCICMCMYMYMYVFIYNVYMYVYTYLYIDCGSQYHCFSVWTMSCMRICIRGHMYVYANVCKYIYMCIFLQ